MNFSDKRLLKLLLLLCYPNVSLKVLEGILSEAVNEERLCWLIDRHRVWNLVAINVKRVDPSYFSSDFHLWLSEVASRCKQKTLLQFKVQSELGQALDTADIKYQFFKGLDLSLRLYGDLNCRFSRDIDLLVFEKDAIVAEKLLLQYGYTPLNDAFTDVEPGGVIRGAFYKDKGYQAAGLPVVELHTRVNNENTDFSKAVTESLLLGGQSLSVLEYLYLCVHAMKSNCHRIKWLIDLACYHEKLNSLMPQWHKNKWAQAQEFGITRQVIACEYLMAQYLGVSVTPRRFIGLNSYSDWISETWLYKYSSVVSLKRIMLAILMNSRFEHRQKAINQLLFCPNDADKEFIDRYAQSDGRYITLFIPFRKLFRYAKRKIVKS